MRTACAREDVSRPSGCIRLRIPMRQGSKPGVVCGCGLRVDLKMCVCLSVCDHVLLKGHVDVTWVSMCAPRLCGVLCVWVCLWVAECVYGRARVGV